MRPGLMLILSRLTDTPAMVVSDRGDVLAQNAMARVLSGDMASGPPDERNMAWRLFTDPAAQDRLPAEDRPEITRSTVADLRASCCG